MVLVFVALMLVMHVAGLVAVVLVAVAFVLVVTGVSHEKPLGLPRPSGPTGLCFD